MFRSGSGGLCLDIGRRGRQISGGGILVSDKWWQCVKTKFQDSDSGIKEIRG